MHAPASSEAAPSHRCFNNPQISINSRHLGTDRQVKNRRSLSPSKLAMKPASTFPEVLGSKRQHRCYLSRKCPSNRCACGRVEGASLFLWQRAACSVARRHHVIRWTCIPPCTYSSFCSGTLRCDHLWRNLSVEHIVGRGVWLQGYAWVEGR